MSSGSPPPPPAPIRHFVKQTYREHDLPSPLSPELVQGTADEYGSMLAPGLPEPPSWRKVLAMVGLPCLISVAAIDPGNLEVDLQAGALLKYRLIWAVLSSSVVGFVLQTLAAHATIHTGEHLAEVCARAYPRHRFISWSIFAFAEFSIVAFDIAEVVGTAFALQLLFRWPLWLGMLVSVFDTMLVLYLQRHGLTKVEIVIEGMLIIVVVCLFYEFALSRPQFFAIIEGTLVPSLGPKPLQGAILAVGILGSVIMSHNLYLHSWLLKQRDNYSRDASDESKHSACRYAAIESAAIFAATFLVNACVVAVAAVLPASATIGLRDAPALLSNVLRSDWAATAWGAALLASGHAATVTGTLASQAVCEGFLDVREGSSPAGVVLATRAVAIVPALGAALLAGNEGTDRLIVLSQVVVSLGIPFAVVPIFKVLAEVGVAGMLVWGGYLAFGIVAMSNLFAVMEIARQVGAEVGRGALAALVGLIGLAGTVIVMLIATPISRVADGKELRTSSEEKTLLGRRRNLPTYT